MEEEGNEMRCGIFQLQLIVHAFALFTSSSFIPKTTFATTDAAKLNLQEKKN